MPNVSYQLLCSLLTPGNGTEFLPMAAAVDDWDAVLEAAAQECVLPSLHARLNELELHQSIPPDILEFLSLVERLNHERNDHILDELQFVVRLLNDVGIEPVLLKGVAYLAVGIYSNTGARYIADIDLLVSERQIKAAVEKLGRNGFEGDIDDPFGQFRHHHPPLRRPGSVRVELHHTLCLGNGASLLPALEFIARSMACDLDAARARVPCPDDLFTHLVIHSQLQHPYNERIWPPLRAMYDLTLVLRRFEDLIDWENIQTRFRRNNKYGVLALHLLQLSEALGAAPPFTLALSGLTRLRWSRRRLLRRTPLLRYFDPIYMSSTVLARRLRVLRNMLRTAHGLRILGKQLLTLDVYRRFATDVLEGRGR